MISIPKTARKSSHLGLYSIDAMLAPTVAAPASPPIVSEIKVGFSDIDAKTEGSGPPPPSARRTSGAPASSRSITSVTAPARTAHKGGAAILSRGVLPGRVPGAIDNVAAGGLAWLLVVTAYAQTDEIQVYDATINELGQFSVELHNNYTPIGRKLPDFVGGIVPNQTLNGVPEWASGVVDWLELGAYLPLYSWTGNRRFLIDGAKLRAEFVVPRAQERSFFYSVNLELSFNARYWEPTRNSGEIRPIIGVRIGPVDLIANPILDTLFQGLGSLDFAPAARVAYNLSESWAAAFEHYADYSQLSHFEPLSRQRQTLFAVVDDKADPVSVEFGIGHGFTAASDTLVLKMIVSHDF
jgi:hypothetical protein